MRFHIVMSGNVLVRVIFLAAAMLCMYWKYTILYFCCCSSFILLFNVVVVERYEYLATIYERWFVVYMNDTRAACIKETPEQHRATIAHTKKKRRKNKRQNRNRQKYIQTIVRIGKSQWIWVRCYNNWESCSCSCICIVCTRNTHTSAAEITGTDPLIILLY